MIKLTAFHKPLQHRRAVAITFCFASLLFAAPNISHAGPALDEWRSEISSVRSLAENDASRAHDDALRLQERLPSDAAPADKARILNLLSRIEIYLAQSDQAEQHANQAMALAKQDEDRVGQVEANLNLALNPINEIKIDNQFAPTIRSMELLREIDRPDLLVEAMLRTVMMDRRTGRAVDSIAMSMKAMEIARSANTPLVMAYAYQGLAIAYDQSGKEKEAREQYTLMLEQARAVPSKLLEADALIGLGGLAASEGRIRAGEETIREAIALYRSAGGLLYANGRLSVLADILLHHGHPAVALPLFDEAIETQEHYDNKQALWWMLNARSLTRQALGQLAAAQADAERSYQLAGELRAHPYLSESAKRLSAIAAANGDFQKAYRYFLEASEATGLAERERVNMRTLDLATRYQLENQKIYELSRRNEQQATELKQSEFQQHWLWSILGGSFMMLAIIAFFLLRLRRSHHQLEEANLQVKRSQNKLQATIDAIPDLLFEMGVDGRYYDYHFSHPNLPIAPAESPLGKTVNEVMPPSAAEVCLSALREANETGVSIGKQFELALSNDKLWFELSVARKLSVDKQEPHFIVLSRDITARKQAEEELRRYKDQLEVTVQQRTAELLLARDAAEAANKAKSVFLANMSHELRTPLNAILGFSTIMRKNPLFPESERRNIDIINHSGEHLLTLINDVLEVAKIEAGRVQLEDAPFDLGGMVRDVTEMMQVRADVKNLKLLIDQSSQFPRYIIGDEARLRQVLINLVGNALKFTQQGGVTIRLGTKNNAISHLLIEVEDSGPGIAPEDQQRIFEPFEQLGQQSDNQGTGLGLTITRQFAQLMNGHISLESTLGKGSLFRVDLPLKQVEEADISNLYRIEEREVLGVAPGQPEYRILIIEDQLENQLLLANLMESAGFQFMVADNGQQGVEIFQTWQPHLIWMDRRMPVMDGLEATKIIRSLPGGKEVKIVAVTASAFLEQRAEMLDAGMDEFVRKPYRAYEIYECLSRQLGVQYIYSDMPASAVEATVLTAEMLSVLPKELRLELENAVKSLESERIGSMIQQIGAYDQTLEKLLNQLADNYDYPAILKALQPH